MNISELTCVIARFNEQEGVCFSALASDASTYVATFGGVIESKWSIRIAFSPHFPARLPDVFVDTPPKETLHIDKDGKLCLFNQSSLLLDTANPVGIISDCVQQAVKILSLQPRTQEYQVELQREFLSYWQKDAAMHIYFALNTDDMQFAEVPILRVEKGYYILSQSIQESKRLLCDVLQIEHSGDVFEEKALVIRLQENANPPSPFEPITWQLFSRYLKGNVAANLRKRLDKYLRRQVKSRQPHQALIIAILPTNDSAIVFGLVTFFRSLQAYQFSVPAASHGVRITRIDYEHMTRRGGSESSLRDKHILLLGCGSVGGFLANNLCQIGITKLDLLDCDDLSLDNVHRHFLGIDAIKRKGTQNKADLMRGVLMGKYAYVEIDALNYTQRDVASVFFSSNRWHEYDLIISALGEPTLNLEINRRLRNAGMGTSFIACFNEPYGVGGHVIISNLRNDSCMQCLYSVSNGGELAFRGSFVSPGQSFERNLSGCAGAFVPYSSLDSQQTALLASRAVVDILIGQLSHNCLMSWKGNDSALKAFGFRTSERYSTESKEIIVNDIKSGSCLVCISDETRGAR